MAVREITKDTSVAEIVKLCLGARRIFDEHGLKGCGGAHGPSEPLAFFAAAHQANLEELLREINAEMQSPSRGPYVYQERLQDYIYRRFFKAGVASVLTVGCCGVPSIFYRSQWERIFCNCIFCLRSMPMPTPWFSVGLECL